MKADSIGRARSHSNPVLAIDMTALWNRKTTGIQRVIRELTPYLASAAAERGWDVVLVRKADQGLEELTRWSGGYDAERLSVDLDHIANGREKVNKRLRGGVVQFFRRTTKTIRNLKVGPIEVRNATRVLRDLIPISIRGKIRRWKSKKKSMCTYADAYVSLSGGILPAMPPPGTPPERTIIVIHDLIPLHHSVFYSTEIVNAFVKNISELAFSPYAANGNFVTASRHIASDIDDLFFSLARQRVAIDVAEWGYDRGTFFPQPDFHFRRRLGLPEDALLVAAVSTQDPRKRFAEIQSAVTSMNAYAVFIGQGRPRREGNAIYLGYVPDDVVRRAYSSSDVVVNWSAAEGFGLPTIEALACGARVVVPPDNPTSIEVGGEYVVVAERADIPSLCEAIGRAASMPRPHPDLSRFDWGTCANIFESLLWPKTDAIRKVA